MKNYIYIMPKKKEGWFDNVLKAGAVIGGAFLAVEILKAFSEPVKLYSCPNCRSDIKYGDKICENCKVDLNWNQKEATNG